MSRTIVTAIADSRPLQSGLETDATPFGAFVEGATFDQLQAFFGDALALFQLVGQGGVTVEPQADRVKISVQDLGGPAAHASGAAARVRQ